MWVAFAFAKATHIFSAKNTYELDIVHTRAVNSLITNELANSPLNNWTGPCQVKVSHSLAPDKVLFFFSPKSADIFLISPWKHVVGTH